MVVRLQTAEGEIKEYKTKYCVGGVDGYCLEYRSNCGLEWKREPEPHEECHHLDCAVYLAKRQSKGGPEEFMISIALAAAGIILWGHGQDLGLALIISGSLTLIAFSSLIGGLRARTRSGELTEYRDKGTINGIKASQIFDV